MLCIICISINDGVRAISDCGMSCYTIRFFNSCNGYLRKADFSKCLCSARNRLQAVIAWRNKWSLKVTWPNKRIAFLVFWKLDLLTIDDALCDTIEATNSVLKICNICKNRNSSPLDRVTCLLLPYNTWFIKNN